MGIMGEFLFLCAINRHLSSEILRLFFQVDFLELCLITSITNCQFFELGKHLYSGIFMCNLY